MKLLVDYYQGANAKSQASDDCGAKVGAERSEPKAKPKIGRRGDQIPWSEATAAERASRRARSTCESGKVGKAHAEGAKGVAAATKLRRATWEGGAMVELVGFLDSGQKKSALEGADCLVFPPFYEGETQGLVLLEAMSAGLPVITTSWRGVPEVLPEGYPWVVTPGSYQELAQAMIAVSGNDWSAAERQRYVEHYTISEHVELLTRKLGGLAEGEG